MSSPPPPPVDGNGRVIPEDEVRVKRFLIREVESHPAIWKHCHPGQRSGRHKQSNLSSEAWQGIMLNLREAFKVEVLLTKAGIQICRKYLRIDFQTYPNYQKCSKIHSNLDSTIRRLWIPTQETPRPSQLARPIFLWYCGLGRFLLIWVILFWIIDQSSTESQKFQLLAESYGFCSCRNVLAKFGILALRAFLQKRTILAEIAFFSPFCLYFGSILRPFLADRA